MGEGGAGVRIIELREALSCAIELKWNLSHRTIQSATPYSDKAKPLVLQSPGVSNQAYVK